MDQPLPHEFQHLVMGFHSARGPWVTRPAGEHEAIMDVFNTAIAHRKETGALLTQEEFNHIFPEHNGEGLHTRGVNPKRTLSIYREWMNARLERLMEFEVFRAIPTIFEASIPGYEAFMRNHTYEELFPRPQGLSPVITTGPSAFKKMGQKVLQFLKQFTPVL